MTLHTQSDWNEVERRAREVENDTRPTPYLGPRMPSRIAHCHQMRPIDHEKPFDIKWASITWKLFPADDIDPVTTFQVLFQGQPISEAVATPEEAIAEATYTLMDRSRTTYQKLHP